MDVAQETIDYIAVSRLHSAYADIATRRAWSELDEIFVPEIPVKVDLRDREPYVFDGRDAFRDFVSAAVDRFEFFELRQDHAERRWSVVYGVYHDQFRRVDDRWWYASRNYSSLARPAHDVDSFPFPTPAPFS
jgi:hypothetical protein